MVSQATVCTQLGPRAWVTSHLPFSLHPLQPVGLTGLLGGAGRWVTGHPVTNAARKGLALGSGQRSRAWPGAGTGHTWRGWGGFTCSLQVVSGLARLQLPQALCPPHPALPVHTQLALPKGVHAGLWSGSWVQPVPAGSEGLPCPRSPAPSASSHPPLSLPSGRPPHTASARAPTAASRSSQSRAAPAQGRTSSRGRGSGGAGAPVASGSGKPLQKP